jgi:hypothetical protein
MIEIHQTVYKVIFYDYFANLSATTPNVVAIMCLLSDDSSRRSYEMIYIIINFCHLLATTQTFVANKILSAATIVVAN